MLLYLIREKFARFYQLLSQQINPLTSCNAVSENGRGTGGEERMGKRGKQRNVNGCRRNITE